jgi:hypothetical protein
MHVAIGDPGRFNVAAGHSQAFPAADFLNSYVRGCLYAAKERMLMQGMWIGGNINLGYMVDNRKSFPNGISNPNSPKYQPFDLYDQVVVKVFETFVMLGGYQRGTLRYLHDNGPPFPDFDNPVCCARSRRVTLGQSQCACSNAVAYIWWDLSHCKTGTNGADQETRGGSGIH